MEMREQSESTNISSATEIETLKKPEPKTRPRIHPDQAKLERPLKHCLFTADKDGDLRQWTLVNNKFELLKNYDNIHKDRIFC